MRLFSNIRSIVLDVRADPLGGCGDPRLFEGSDTNAVVSKTQTNSRQPDWAQVCEVPFRPSVNPSARERAHARGEDAAV